MKIHVYAYLVQMHRNTYNYYLQLLLTITEILTIITYNYYLQLQKYLQRTTSWTTVTQLYNSNNS